MCQVVNTQMGRTLGVPDLLFKFTHDGVLLEQVAGDGLLQRYDSAALPDYIILFSHNSTQPDSWENDGSITQWGTIYFGCTAQCKQPDQEKGGLSLLHPEWIPTESKAKISTFPSCWSILFCGHSHFRSTTENIFYATPGFMTSYSSQFSCFIPRTRITKTHLTTIFLDPWLLCKWHPRLYNDKHWPSLCQQKFFKGIPFLAD